MDNKPSRKKLLISDADAINIREIKNKSKNIRKFQESLDNTGYTFYYPGIEENIDDHMKYLSI